MSEEISKTETVKIDVKTREGFSWLKWVTGIFNPLNFAKYSAFLIQMVLLITIIFFLSKAGVWVKEKFFPKPAPVATQPVISGVSGGTVNSDSSAKDTRNKYGLINL